VFLVVEEQVQAAQGAMVVVWELDHWHSQEEQDSATAALELITAEMLARVAVEVDTGEVQKAAAMQEASGEVADLDTIILHMLPAAQQLRVIMV
jgi:hypothetical protein